MILNLKINLALGVAASNHAMIYVICSPTGPYFGAGTRSISLYAVYDSFRSWPGGTGGYKLVLRSEERREGKECRL